MSELKELIERFIELDEDLEEKIEKALETSDDLDEKFEEENEAQIDEMNEIYHEIEHMVFNEEFIFVSNAQSEEKEVVALIISDEDDDVEEFVIPVYTDEVLSKISEEVPKDYRNVCSHISYQMSSSENINSEFFMAICESLRRQTCLNLYYCNLKNEHSERLVEPEQLLNYGGIWYLICFDHSTNDLRTFNMSRIRVRKVHYSL